MNGQMFSLGFALLGVAVVFGTEVADRRMPIFVIIGIGGALASSAFSRASLLWALGAVAAQVLFIVVYRSVAAPVNAELTRHARAGSVPPDARALQARWDSVIVARVFLNGVAVVALAAALVGSAH